MMNNHTLPGFNGDDYDADIDPLTAAQLAARDAEWPELAGEGAEVASGWPENEISAPEAMRKAA